MSSTTLDRRATHSGRKTISLTPAQRQDLEEFLLGDYVRDRIEFRVDRLAVLFDLDEYGQEVMRQRMYQEICQAWPRFNPAISKRETFASCVLNLFFKHVLRAGVTDQRHESRAPLGFDDVAQGFEPVGNETPAGECDEQGHRELRLDVEAVIQRMPPDLQRICRMLKVCSGREAARRLGIGKTTLYRVQQSIRTYFEEAGIGGNGENGGTLSPQPQI